MRPTCVASVVIAAVVACAPSPTPAEAPAEAAVPVVGIQRTALQGEAAPGLSGMGREGAGSYLAVAERERELVRLREQDGQLVVTARLAIAGVPRGLDTESLAVLGPGEIALGTEGHAGRARDLILIARVSERGAEVVDRLAFEYGPWGLRASVNHGLEALCFADGVLIAATEEVGTEGGKRFAPIARYDRASKQWAYGRLWLTSGSGKISSFDCRKSTQPGMIEVVAIERHFGVGRVLSLELPRDGGLTDLTPRVAVELIGRFDPLPNLESITWADDGSLLLVSDNSNQLVKPPADVFRIAPSPSPPPGTTGAR